MAVKMPRLLVYAGYLFTILWSFVVIMRSLKRIITQGAKAYFHVKMRGPPEELQDPSLGEHGYLQLSSVKIHYVAKGPEDAPLMLLVHGFPEFWYSWRYQIKEFSSEYRTVAIDMRGYGDSDKPKGVAEYTVDKLVGDIKEIIEQFGYEKCVLVAHDWGGIVAWNFAQMYPEMVEKLITCNIPHISAYIDFISSSYKQVLMSWYVFFFQIPWLPELVIRSEDLAFFKLVFGSRSKDAKRGSFTEADIELYKYVFSPPGSLTGPINYYRALYKYGIPLDYPTEKVIVPSLMIWGEKDRALAKQLAEMTADYVEDYQIKYVDASHWVQQEEPEIVNQHMRDFLNQ